MSQKQLTLLHNQSFKNIQLLDVPYPIVQTLVQHLGLLTSQKLWCKIIKCLSLYHRQLFQEFFSKMINEEESQQNQVQTINQKWTALGTLSLLIITWIRLGKFASNTTLKQIKNFRLYIQTGPKQQKGNGTVMIQIQGSKLTSKQQYCRFLHGFIINQCKKYGLAFQYQLTDKVQLKLSTSLFYERIQLPSILSISQRESQKSNLIMPKPAEQKLNYLNIREYSQLLVFLSQIHNCQYRYNIRHFADIFCTKMNQKLNQNTKNSSYYLKLSPLHIFVKEQQTGDINFQVELPLLKLYYYEQTKVPSNLDDYPYIDKESLKARQIQKTDYWSAGLSLLSIISQYTIQDFQQIINQLAGKQQRRHKFTTRMVQKLSEEAQFNSEVVINTLRTWLKLNQLTKQATSTQSSQPKVAPYFTTAQTTENNPSEKQPVLQSVDTLDWLSTVISKKVGQSTQSTTSDKSSSQKNLEFIRNVNPNGTNTNNSNNSKNYTVYTTSASSNNFKEVPNSQWNNKQINKTATDIKLQFLNKAPNALNLAWETTLQKLNSLTAAFNRVRQKLKIISFSLLKEQQKPYDILAVKMQPETVKQYTQSLLKNKSIFESLGYKSFPQPHILQTMEICSVCNQRKTLYKNNACNHVRCIECYLQYLQSIFKSKPSPFQFIKCPESNCQVILSYNLLKYFLEHTTSENQTMFAKYLMDHQITNKRDLIRRCNNKNCKQNSALYQINPNNRLFFCQLCTTYRCTNCCEIYHGVIECTQYKNSQAESLQNQLKVRLKSLYDVKKPKDKINAVGYGKLMRYLMLQKPKMFQQLEASIVACATCTWSIKFKSLNIVLSLSTNLTVTDQVVSKISNLLTEFYKKLSEIGSKSDEQLKNIAEQLRPVVNQMLQMYQFRQSIIYIATIS